MLITSNRNISEWGMVFGAAVVATAFLPNGRLRWARSQHARDGEALVLRAQPSEFDGEYRPTHTERTRSAASARTSRIRALRLATSWGARPVSSATGVLQTLA
jgi:hypothetical protein